MGLIKYKLKNCYESKHFATCIGRIEKEEKDYLIASFTPETHNFRGNKNTHTGLRWSQLEKFIIRRI